MTAVLRCLLLWPDSCTYLWRRRSYCWPTTGRSRRFGTRGWKSVPCFKMPTGEQYCYTCINVSFLLRHYIDNCLTAEEKLKLGDSGNPNSKQNYPFKQFCAQIFPRVSCLSLHLCFLEKILVKFRKWKGCQPACGVILLNPSLDKVLLVQEFGGNKNWGFPKGKCEGNESPESCAAREAFEEVGIDVVKMIDTQEKIERKIGTKVGR